MALFGLVFAPLLSGRQFQLSVLLCLSLGLALMGLGYGPLGAALAALFPTAVRYTGASLTFNLAGILGASLTPYAATTAGHETSAWQAVGCYLFAAGLLHAALRCCCCRAMRWRSANASRISHDRPAVSG